MLDIFGTSHVRHDLLWATSSSGGFFRTLVESRSARQMNRGRDRRSTRILLGF